MGEQQLAHSDLSSSQLGQTTRGLFGLGGGQEPHLSTILVQPNHPACRTTGRIREESKAGRRGGDEGEGDARIPQSAALKCA